MEVLKERDSIRMGPGANMDMLGNINPSFTGQIFPPMVTVIPNLDAILQDVPEAIWLQIKQTPQDNRDEDNPKINS